jgi:hypothetical protein
VIQKKLLIRNLNIFRLEGRRGVDVSAEGDGERWVQGSRREGSEEGRKEGVTHNQFKLNRRVVASYCPLSGGARKGNLFKIFFLKMGLG